jgi:hypothetical protein
VNQAWLCLMLWGAVAIVLVVVYGSQNLSRKHQKQVEPVQPQVSAAPPRAGSRSCKDRRGGPTRSRSH